MQKHHQFPPDVIHYALWLYSRFNLSHRDIEQLSASCGFELSRGSIRPLCYKFGPTFARRGCGDTFFIDEVFVKIQGQLQHSWRAVDQDGEIVEMFVGARRDCKATKRFYRRLRNRHGDKPRKVVTEK